MGWLSSLKSLLLILSRVAEHFRNKKLIEAGKNEVYADQAEIDNERDKKARKIDIASDDRDNDHFLRPPKNDK